jgi:hypothetical protein
MFLMMLAESLVIGLSYVIAAYTVFTLSVKIEGPPVPWHKRLEWEPSSRTELIGICIVYAAMAACLGAAHFHSINREWHNDRMSDLCHDSGRVYAPGRYGECIEKDKWNEGVDLIIRGTAMKLEAMASLEQLEKEHHAKSSK